MIWIYLAIHWIGGTLGYMLMRQGFLVDFEGVLGKRNVWQKADVFSGIVSGLAAGWVFVLIAFFVKGKFCLKRRPSKISSKETP